MRNNSYRISNESKTKTITIFKNGEHINVNKKSFENKLFDLSRLFCDYK